MFHPALAFLSLTLKPQDVEGNVVMPPHAHVLLFSSCAARAINVSGPNIQSEEFLELANGCLCCSIKDTGIAAVEKLMQRKGSFDYILLETTGLADPGLFSWELVQWFLGSWCLRSYCFYFLAERRVLEWTWSTYLP
jgi:hypothetical protein